MQAMYFNVTQSLLVFIFSRLQKVKYSMSCKCCIPRMLRSVKESKNTCDYN